MSTLADRAAQHIECVPLPWSAPVPQGQTVAGSIKATIMGRCGLFDVTAMCGPIVQSTGKFLRRGVRSSWIRITGLVLPATAVLLVCGVPGRAQQLPETLRAAAGPSGAKETAAHPEQGAQPQSTGTISGTISAPTGAVLVGARVTLTREDHSPPLETLSDEDGQFSFGSIPPGPFRLTFSAEGFATQTFSETLHPGEARVVSQIILTVASGVTEVSVVVPRVEVAEEEIKAEEKQRVLGIIPNFYVSYIPNAAPLTPEQKFELAWKSAIDPITIATVGFFAGVEQAQNHFNGYGQGAQGYGKRFGAGLADSTTSIFLGGAVFPSMFKQDPRYFYKGTGSVRSRILYALAMAVICKSDKGHWQANYSTVLGDLASGGISNLYYPSTDRGAELVFENTALGVGANMIGNLFQEFVVRKVTPHLPMRNSGQR